MRSLYILRGVPGSGKSTFIRENGLEHYTISVDQLRALKRGLSYAFVEDHYEATIVQNPGRGALYEMVISLMEERLALGLTTFLDATNLVKSDLQAFTKLAKTYRYRVYVVNFEITLEEAKERNSKRKGVAKIPNIVIDNMYATKKVQDVNFKGMLTPTEALETLNYNYEHLDKVHVIGDVHASATVVRNFLKNIPMNEKIVFVGDYFDKGIEHEEMLTLMEELLEQRDVIFLRGNHDRMMEKWLFFDYDYTKHHHHETLTYIDNLEVREKAAFKKRLRKLSNSFRDMYAFESGGKIFMVTHGGIIPAMVDINKEKRCLEGFMLHNTWDMVCGIDDYRANIDERFNIDCPENLYQIHGHRNWHGLDMKNGHSYNLEQGIEYGRHLAVVSIQNGKPQIKKVKNDIFDPHHEKYKKDPIYKFMYDAENDNFIDKIEMKSVEGVHSYNFNRLAFRTRTWNDNTVKARGLFIDKDGKIVARGFDKFFNLNERPETNQSAIFSWNYPLTIATKENGSLGMAANVHGNAFYATKNRDYGDFRDRLKEQLDKHLGSLRGAFFARLEELGATALFEVVDKRDPHIVGYKEDGLVLIGLVKNEWEQVELDLGLLDEFNFNKAYTEVVEDKAGLIDVFRLYSQTPELMVDVEVGFGEKYSLYTEGVVITDATGRKVKIKGTYYSYWKKVRGYLEGKNEYALGRELHDYLTANNVSCKTDGVIAVRKQLVSGNVEIPMSKKMLQQMGIVI